MRSAIGIDGLRMSRLALILIMLLIFCGLSLAADQNCNSCSSCTTAIAAAAPGDTVYLTGSLGSISSTCINFMGKDNVVFDCQGYLIDGTDAASSYAIYMSLNASNGGSVQSTIRNCVITDFNAGIYLHTSNYNFIENVNISSCFNGIYLYNSVGNDISAVRSVSNSNGIYLQASSNNSIADSAFLANSFYGVRLYGNSDYNNMESSRIEGSSLAGIWLDEEGPDDPQYNLIFNNYFNNTNNYKIDAGIAGENYFSTTQDCATPNILGDTCIGGNFWTSSGYGFSDSCTDTQAPLSICDSYHDMTNGTSIAIDWLPLDSDTIIFDITPPTQSSISSGTPTYSSAAITWTTNEAATGLVKYRLALGTVGVYPYQTAAGTSGTSHSRPISGISASTTYYYVVNSTDASGNSVQSSELSFTTAAIPDTTPPVVTISSPSNGSIVVSNVNFGLTVATDEACSCIVDAHKLGSAATETTTDLNMTASSNMLTHTRYFNATGDSTGFGNYFTVICTDTSENSAAKTSYFKINDSTSPVITVVSPTPADEAYSASPNATIKFRVDDPAVTVRLSFDNATNVTLTLADGYYTKAYTGLAEGQHDIDIYATDAKGHTSSVSRIFIVDLTEPDLDIISPPDGGTVTNCMDVVLNLTTDEEADCEYELFVEDVEEYDDCQESCTEDYDDCYEDSETTTERQECRLERNECQDSCEEDRYQSEDDGTLREEYIPQDCVDSCNDDFDTCDDSCTSTKARCIASSSGTEARNECVENYNSCRDECRDTESDCSEECYDEVRYTYSKTFGKCFESGNYLVRFTCVDLAENTGEENITFRLSDTTAPKVTSVKPDTAQTKTSVTLQATTDEHATCRFANIDLEYAKMPFSFSGSQYAHTYALSNLIDGNYTYYVRCSDLSGNVMDSSALITFSVSLADAPSNSDGQTTGQGAIKEGQTFENVETGIASVLAISNDALTVVDLTIVTNEDIKSMTLEVEKISAGTDIIPPEGTVYQFFKVNKIGVSNKQIDKITMKFRVEKSWLDSKSVSADSIVLSSYETSWQEITTNRVSDDAKYTYYQSELAHLSTFAVLARKAQPGQTDPDVSGDGTTGGQSDGTGGKKPGTEEPVEIIEDDKGFFSWIWILIIVCVLAVGGGAAGFIYVKSHRHPQQEFSATPDAQGTPTSDAAASRLPAFLEQVAAAASFLQPDDEFGRLIIDHLSGNPDIGQAVSALCSQGYKKDEVLEKLIAMDLLSRDEASMMGYSAGVTARGSHEAEAYGTISSGSDALGQDAYGIGSEHDYEGEFYDYEKSVKGYIQASLASGMSPVSVADNLIAAGHDEAYVNSLMDYHVMLEQQRRQKAYLDKDDDEISHYIMAALESGMSAEGIRIALVEAGHDVDDVDDRIFRMLDKHMKSTSSPDNGMALRQEGDSLYHQPGAGPVQQGPGMDASRSAGDGAAGHGVLPKIDKTLLDDTTNYIMDALEDNIPKGAIKKALVRSGHSPADVDRNFHDIDGIYAKYTADLAAYAAAKLGYGQKKGEIEKELKENKVDKKIIKTALKAAKKLIR